MCSHDSRWPKDTINITYDGGERFNDIVKALCFLTGSNYEEQDNLRNLVNYRHHIRNIDTGRILDNYHTYSDSINEVLDKLRDLNANGVKYELVTVNNNWGEWIEWGFFRVKGFKKGTLHAEFKDEEVWRKFNQRVAEIRGWKNMVAHSKKR